MKFHIICTIRRISTICFWQNLIPKTLLIKPWLSSLTFLRSHHHNAPRNNTIMDSWQPPRLSPFWWWCCDFSSPWCQINNRPQQNHCTCWMVIWVFIAIFDSHATKCFILSTSFWKQMAANCIEHCQHLVDHGCFTKQCNSHMHSNGAGDEVSIGLE